MTRCVMLVMSGMMQMKLLIKCGVEKGRIRENFIYLYL